MEILEYHGRQMDPTPYGKSLQSVAQCLDRRQPTTVILKPGDATRYELVLVPMWMPSLEFGNYHPADRFNGLLVTRIVRGHPTGSGIIILTRSSHDDLDLIINGNNWTGLLFEWWFALLKEELDKVRATTV